MQADFSEVSLRPADRCIFWLHNSCTKAAQQAFPARTGAFHPTANH